MGQYQQWLHFHEVDGHLQSQMEELVNELSQLQERGQLYKQILQSQQPYENNTVGKIAPVLHNNEILQALADELHRTISSNGHTTAESTTTAFSSFSEIIPNESASSISSALFAQGNLPYFETQTTSQTAVNTTEANTSEFPSYPDQLPPSVPHYDMTLLPEDMVSFFDQHSATDPQMELPWWLRNLANVSNANGPVDQESIRTNRLVQRWLERWGKQSPASQQPSQSPQVPQSPQSQKPGGN